MHKLYFVRYYSENRATKNNGGVLSMRMQVILDSLFASPDSAPIRGGKKGEFRDWTIESPTFALLQRPCVSLSYRLLICASSDYQRQLISFDSLAKKLMR